MEEEGKRRLDLSKAYIMDEGMNVYGWRGVFLLGNGGCEEKM
jgi:hypothetical protein